MMYNIGQVIDAIIYNQLEWLDLLRFFYGIFNYLNWWYSRSIWPACGLVYSRVIYNAANN